MNEAQENSVAIDMGWRIRCLELATSNNVANNETGEAVVARAKTYFDFVKGTK